MKIKQEGVVLYDSGEVELATGLKFRYKIDDLELKIESSGEAFGVHRKLEVSNLVSPITAQFPPEITSIVPSMQRTNQIITINGNNFGNTRGSSKVLFGATEATDYISWSNTQIEVRVPVGVSAGTVQVKVATNPKWTPPTANLFVTTWEENQMWFPNDMGQIVSDSGTSNGQAYKFPASPPKPVPDVYLAIALTPSLPTTGNYRGIFRIKTQGSTSFHLDIMQGSDYLGGDIPTCCPFDWKWRTENYANYTDVIVDFNAPKVDGLQLRVLVQSGTKIWIDYIEIIKL